MRSMLGILQPPKKKIPARVHNNAGGFFSFPFFFPPPSPRELCSRRRRPPARSVYLITVQANGHDLTGAMLLAASTLKNPLPTEFTQNPVKLSTVVGK